MLQISSKKPFKTIISAHLHTSAAGARDKTPGLFYVLDRMKSFLTWVRILKSGFNKDIFLLILFQHMYFLYIFNSDTYV